jgi:hypothetical protein
MSRERSYGFPRLLHFFDAVAEEAAFCHSLFA